MFDEMVFEPERVGEPLGSLAGPGGRDVFCERGHLFETHGEWGRVGPCPLDGHGCLAETGCLASGFVHDGARDTEALDGGDDFSSELEGEAVVCGDESELDGIDGEAVHGLFGQGFSVGFGSEPDDDHSDGVDEGNDGAGVCVAAEQFHQFAAEDGAECCDETSGVVGDALAGGADGGGEELGEVEGEETVECGSDESAEDGELEEGFAEAGFEAEHELADGEGERAEQEEPEAP